MPSKKHEKVNQPTAQMQRSWHRWLPLFVIAAGIAAYYNSFHGVFLFDEERRILNNELLHRLWPPWDLLTGRRPVVDISLAINYAIGELNVTGYHTFNLAVHILAALTLLGVLRRTLLCKDLRDQCGRWAPRLALVVALIWVVHPLQTQSVTYIIQRGEALMGLFYLLTLYAVIRGAGVRHGQLWFAAAIVFCALGMGSKAVMVTAPVVVLLYDRVFISKSFSETLRQRWGLYLGLAATWGILFTSGIVQGVLDTSPRPTTHVGFAYKGVTPLEYLQTQAGVIVHYLRLSLWPHPLCLDYDWPVANSPSAIGRPLILVAPLLAGTVWTFRKKPWLGFVGAWFFLILAPTSSIIPIKDLAFEHRMYLPLASVIVLVVVGCHTLLGRILSRPASGEVLRRIIATSLIVIAVVNLTYATVRRNTYYHSAFAMWSDVVARRPNNPRARENLGIALEGLGRSDKAERAYRDAIRVDPDYVNAYSNLGVLLSKQGRYDEAIEQYRSALRIDRRHLFARLYLGTTLVQQGMIDEGINELRTVLRGAPGRPAVRYALGHALVASGEIDEAIEQYREALRLNPLHAGARYGLGNALARQGRFDEAAKEYREAVRLRPASAEARHRLAIALLRSGMLDEAIEQLRETLRIRPDHAMARQALKDALDEKTRLQGR